MGIQTQQLFVEAAREHQRGNFAGAQKLYAQVLTAEPNHAEALHQLAIVALQTGNPGPGLALVERAVGIKPGEATYHITRGMALAALGRVDEAIQAYYKSLLLEPDSLGGLVNLGNAFMERGRVEEAIGVFEKAAARHPTFAPSFVNLGCALRDVKKFDAAKKSFERAIILQPKFAEAEYLLGATLADLGKLDEAVAAYQRAIGIRGEFFDAMMGLGSALFRLDRFEESDRAYEQAVALRPGDFVARNDRACSLMELGKIDEGIEVYQLALAIKPDDANSHLHLGMGLLLRGDFEKGLVEYEWRPTARAGLPGTRWDGGRLNGKTLLIHEEQGLGDAIQFVRYVPMAARASGASIVLECAPELARLFGGVEGIERIVPRGKELPACDAHCSLLSLPYVMKTRLESIPATVPYLKADAGMIEQWRERLGASRALKVGLVWAGSTTHRQDRRRSVQLKALSPLWKVRGVCLISLQKGRKADGKSNGLELIDWTEELHDLADTAALIANLDLVISVDTAVAHLAGAMGKAVWVLVQRVPDWRWMMDRGDSPWYPTMRLFRQEKADSWDEPIGRVVEELEKLTRAACQA
jgi:tetratricopeptide (TPR) repeat protein